jgi:hypothetical protein
MTAAEDRPGRSRMDGDIAQDVLRNGPNVQSQLRDRRSWSARGAGRLTRSHGRPTILSLTAAT